MHLHPGQQKPLNICKASPYRCEQENKLGVRGVTQTGYIAAELVRSVFVMHKNLFSWDSFKIVTTVFPFFVGTRMIDEKVQSCFYDEFHHKNVNQMPHWCSHAAKYSIAIPIILFGTQAFLSRDDNMRITSQTFLMGMPFVIFGKDLLKKLRFDVCRRPWNEKFSCIERSTGGFPSGHMAEATYIAVLYGLLFGQRFAIPLSLVAAGVSATFLNCNRHYAPQLIAGAGFGAVYAVAASKAIDERLGRLDVKVALAVDQNGSPAFQVSGRF